VTSSTLLGLGLPGPQSDGELVEGRYRLLSRLGRGATAQVWSAEDERLQRIVALKVFSPDGTHRHRERVELELMVRLSHPGLVSVYDAGSYTDGGRQRTYVVLEFVAGGTLRDRLAGERLPVDRVAAIGSDVGRALGYIHACGVVHRDVKPANILLTRLDDAIAPFGNDVPIAKLADFGVARMLDAVHLTEPGTTVGTANYLSPEQLRGGSVGPPSDVYSLGLVLLEALTGRMVYPGSSVLSAEHLGRTPMIPTTLGERWVDLLAVMTEHDPSRRPPANAVAEALCGLVRS
jgi:eukaryotic-like serine/threonine-protein kinase